METSNVKSIRKKKKLHFSVKLIIGLIVTALLCLISAFSWCAFQKYDALDTESHQHFTYWLESEWGWGNGYISIENGVCTRHFEVDKVVRKEGYDKNGDWHDVKYKSVWKTEPCDHIIHNYKNRYDYAFQALKNGYILHQSSDWDPEFGNYIYDESLENYYINSGALILPFYILFAVFIILSHFKNKHYEICVEEKRILGKIGFGKRVTILPWNITSVSKKGKYKVVITTADTTFKFKFIKNADEIIEAIDKLDKTVPTTPTEDQLLLQTDGLSKELKIYLDLYESGIISKEEYEKKYIEITKG